MVVEAVYGTAQRLSALETANEIRTLRAALKRRIRAREVSVASLVRDPEWFVSSVPIYELLCWAPRVGHEHANRWLKRADVWPLKPVGRLTDAQRVRLVRQMERRP